MSAPTKEEAVSTKKIPDKFVVITICLLTEFHVSVGCILLVLFMQLIILVILLLLRQTVK